MELLGVIASLLGVAAQAGAQNDQKNLGYMNLYETKRSNRKNEKLATSSREDAYGNVVEYDPVFGWRIKNTPMTKSILDAEQNETLTSLTEDAARNRNQARRKDERSIMGDDEFERAFNNFKYRPKKTEGEYIADATQEKLLARRKGADETAAAVNKALLRTGNSSNIPSVFKAARDAEANDFESALLGGKRQGMQDFLGMEGGKEGQDMQELEFLRGIADDTTSMAPRFSNFNSELSGTRDNALATLLQTLQGNEGNRQSATASLMQVLGNSPDFAPLASSLSKVGGDFASMFGGGGMGDGSGYGGGPPIPRPRAEGALARRNAGF